VFYVYIIENSIDKSHYVGFSEDIRKRLKSHEWHEVKSTKTRGNHTLVWYCGFKDKKKALDFEKYLKSGSGFAFKNKHLI
jgi:predicted GIY-YIG superfamily endonuclease